MLFMLRVEVETDVKLPGPLPKLSIPSRPPIAEVNDVKLKSEQGEESRGQEEKQNLSLSLDNTSHVLLSQKV